MTDCSDDRVWFFQCMPPGEGWKYLHLEAERELGPGACGRLRPFLCVPWPHADRWLRENPGTYPELFVGTALLLERCFEPSDSLRDHCAPCVWHVFLAKLKTPELQQMAWKLSRRTWPTPCSEASP